MSVHAKMKTHISKTAQRLEDEVESRPWHGWPGIIAWRWVGRANKLDINFFGHKLGASANMIYWFADSVRVGTERPRAVEQTRDAAPSTPSTRPIPTRRNVLAPSSSPPSTPSTPSTRHSRAGS